MTRAFDWQTLLREQHVPYIESGPNVKRGELAIQCPFCGSADPSKHMGLNLETGWWSCWRNRAEHSGKSPLRLIMRLLNVPYAKAREIAGLDESYVDPEGFDAVAARVMGRDQAIAKPNHADRKFLAFHPDFAPIDISKIRTSRHWLYLERRGFNEFDIFDLVRTYTLRAGIINEWKDRVILPFFQDGKLVTWTGRAIAPSRMRYRDLDLDQSLMAPKETLFNHDAMLEGGKVLIIQEGPIDVLKVDYYGQRFGVRSVGLSTNSVSEQQAFLLQGAVGKFEQVIVMMDTKSQLGIVDSMKMKAQLRFLGELQIMAVPYGAGDGGALAPGEVKNLALSITSVGTRV